MHIIVVLLLIFSSVWSIEIDRDLLKEEIRNSPKNVALKIVLARTYISQSDFDEVKKLLSEVLGIEKDNQNALSLIEDIKKIKSFTSDKKDKKISDSKKLILHSDKLFKNRQYKQILQMHKVLKRNSILFDRRIDLNAIWSSIYTKDYSRAFKIIKKSSLSKEEKYYLKIKTHQAKGEYQLSENLYKEALKDRDSENLVVGLYELYIKQHKYKAARELVSSYKNVALEKISPLPKVKENVKPKSEFEITKGQFFKLKDGGQKDKAFELLSKYVKKDSKNEEAVLLLANHLYWDGKIEESFRVLKPFIGKTNNKEIVARYSDILLQKAVKEHKAKNYDKALKQYIDHYKINQDAKTAKEIAEIYFMKEEFKESLSYYKTYLNSNTKDYKIRFRYAEALQMQKSYLEAQKEYKKVLGVNSELYTLSLYRYSNMLMSQKDERKWNKSRRALEYLKKELQKEEKSKNRDSLLRYTEIALKKVSKPMPKPGKFKDIMLLPGQKKIIKKGTIFEGSKMEARDITSVKSMFGQRGVVEKRVAQKDIEFNFHMLEDSSIDNLSLGIRLNNIAKFKDALLSLESKKSRVKTGELEHTFDSFYTHFDMQNFSIGVGIDKFEKFEDLNIELLYNRAFVGHQMTFGFSYQNAAFVNSLAYMIEHRINTVQFSLYDAILLRNLKEAEVSLELNIFDDENINVNSWLNYPIYTMMYRDFENSFSLSGSYLFNSKTDLGYFPARFFDGNYINMRPTINLGKIGKIGGFGGMGYSIREKNFLYNYGLYAQFLVFGLFDINIDCRHYQSGYSPDGANECYAKAAYKW